MAPASCALSPDPRGKTPRGELSFVVPEVSSGAVTWPRSPAGSQRERLVVDGFTGHAEVRGDVGDVGDESLGAAHEHVAVGQVGNERQQRLLVDRCPVAAADQLVQPAAAVPAQPPGLSAGPPDRLARSPLPISSCSLPRGFLTSSLTSARSTRSASRAARRMTTGAQQSASWSGT